MTTRGLSRWCAIGGVVLVVLASGGCEKVQRGMSNSVSPCFRVLPQAHAAVGGQGNFVSVSRLRGDRINQVFPKAPPPPPHGEVRDVCVVAYHGKFDPAKIQHLIPFHKEGSFALVFVGVRTQQVRAVFLSDTLPKPLHRH